MGKALQLECKVAVTLPLAIVSPWPCLLMIAQPQHNLKPPPAPAAAGASCGTSAFIPIMHLRTRHLMKVRRRISAV